MCDKKINLILIIFIKKVAIYYVYVCDEQSLISLYVDKKIYLMLQIRLVNLAEINYIIQMTCSSIYIYAR